MLTDLELFIESIFLNLLQGSTEFHFTSSLLNFLEDPSNEGFLAIARFSKESYKIFEQKLKELIPKIEILQSEHKNYKHLFHSIVSNILCEYHYTFTAESGVIVQSNLIFLLMDKLKTDCVKNLIGYLCDKEMWDSFSYPQLYSNSFIFSTVVHELLKKGLDSLALKCAIHADNKTVLFVQDFIGLTPIELAQENNCSASFEYLSKIKEIGSAVNILN